MPFSLPFILTACLSPGVVADQVALPWRRNVHEAKAHATQEGKDLFILFIGSDWSPPCRSLQLEILTNTDFVQKMADQYAYLLLDYPAGKEAAARVVDANLNTELKGAYSVERFPTVILASPAGAPYVRHGFEPGGPVRWLRTLENKQGTTQPIRELLATKEPTEAQLRTAFRLLDQQRLLGHPAYESYLALAEKADPDGTKGLKKMAVCARENAVFDRYLAKLARDREPTPEQYRELAELMGRSPNLSGKLFAQVAFGVGNYLFDKQRYAEAKTLYERARREPTSKVDPQAQKTLAAKIARCEELLKQDGGSGNPPTRKNPDGDDG